MIEPLVEQIQSRFAELERQMSDPAVIADRERYAEVGREYRELGPARELVREYRKLHDDLEGARELLAEDGDDPELRRLVAEAPARLEELEERIRLAMVERDPNDAKNVIVEIRAGTGGDEAALFAGDLYKMLSRYAESRGFSTEVLSQSPAEVGGFKEVTFAIKGEGAYSVFKYEGGTHRVQRVPKTESQGRIHTSTATVAVLPEAEEGELEIDPGDRRIELAVDRRVLIPRPETELLVEVAVELRPRRVLDVGTGSGAVALAVADELGDVSVRGTDVSASA